MNRQILRLAIPNIVSNISIPLLGFVDLAILGHLESEIYIGAIALGSLIFSFLYSGFGFLRMGTSGLTAQSFGAKDKTESMAIITRSLLAAGVFSLLMLLLQYPIAQGSFRLIEGSREVESLARQYFYIRIWAAPATLGLMALTGWFIGMQDAKTPMYIALIVNILNVFLNYFFVYYLHLKSDGVAYGTVIAQYAGLIAAIIFFLKKHRAHLPLMRRAQIRHYLVWKKFFKINGDIFIRTIALIFVLSFFTSKSAAINDQILAVNTILFQFFLIFSYLIDGFAYAAEALVGKAIGAKDHTLLRKSIKNIFLWGIYLAIPFTLSYLIFGNGLLKLLTNNVDVLELGREYTKYILFIPLFSFAAFIWDGIFIGATATKPLRNSMLIAAAFVFMPLFLILKTPLGNDGLWIALLIFMLSRGLIQTIQARKWIFKFIQTTEIDESV